MRRDKERRKRPGRQRGVKNRDTTHGSLFKCSLDSQMVRGMDLMYTVYVAMGPGGKTYVGIHLGDRDKMVRGIMASGGSAFAKALNSDGLDSFLFQDIGSFKNVMPANSMVKAKVKELESNGVKTLNGET